MWGVGSELDELSCWDGETSVVEERVSRALRRSRASRRAVICPYMSLVLSFLSQAPSPYSGGLFLKTLKVIWSLSSLSWLSASLSCCGGGGSIGGSLVAVASVAIDPVSRGSVWVDEDMWVGVLTLVGWSCCVALS